ncbi:MAG TPA: condensation domain-containing protein, partial [Dehalococcoidia bacterium]
MPLSYAQQRLWFLDQLAPGNPFYNVPFALRLSFPLNVVALQRSLNEIVRRHEVLRTSFALGSDGLPVQRIAPQLDLSLPVLDLRSLPDAERTARAHALAADEARLPFDLAGAPLVRARLLRLGDADYLLLLTLHHIVCDGWSMGVLSRELSALYPAFASGQPSPLAALPLQYADFAVWQRTWLAGARLQQQLAYWRTQLADLPTLDLPTDHPRPPVATYQGAYLPFTLDAGLTAHAKALSQQAGATLFMTLLSAFQALLLRYSGQDTLVVGTPIAGRNRRELEGMIGFFVNTLVLKTDLSGEPTFREALGRVKEVALGAYSHQDVPFEMLVETLQPQRDLSRNPLCQVIFQFGNNPGTAPDASPSASSVVRVDRGTSIFDVSFTLWETHDGLGGEIEYNTDLFERESIERLARHFRSLLEAAVTQPDLPISRLPLLSPDERQQLLVAWNATHTAYPRDVPVHRLFEQQAARTPDALAVSDDHQQLTYRQLNQQANQLARFL